MRYDIVEKGGHYGVRCVWFGFIPFYWTSGGDSGWNLIPFWRDYDLTKEEAESLVEYRKEAAFQKRRFRAAKSNVIQTTKIP